MNKTVKIAYRNMWPKFCETDYFFIPKIIEYELGLQCELTSINQADLVINAVYQYLPYSSHFNPNIPINKNQKNIHVIGENNNSLEVNKYDLSVGFDVLDNEKYFRFPLWAWYVNFWNEEQYELKPFKKHILIDYKSIDKKRNIDITGRPLAACAFIGNFKSKERLDFIEKLRKIMPVDIYGPATTGFVKDKKEIAKNYQFIVCFENSIYPGYHTEKLPEAYVSECIPIYYSADTYEIDFNKKCMVNRVDFLSDEECIDFIYRMTDYEKQCMINEPMTNNKIQVTEMADRLKQILDVC